MDLSWDDVYQTEGEDGLVSATDVSDQVLYTTLGKPVTLLASYRNRSLHETGDVETDLTGLVLDGPQFFHIGGQYEGKLVPEAGYTLPEEIHLYTKYTDGREIEIQNYSWQQNYTYDYETGEIVLQHGPYGADNKLLIRAAGIETEGAPAGVVSGTEYAKPAPVYGPFNWSVPGETDGTLVESKTSVSGVDVPCVIFTPNGIGETVITATDGTYTLNFKVVSEAPAVTSIDLPEDQHRIHLRTDATYQLNPILSYDAESEISTLSSEIQEGGVTYKSFNPEVASVDENGWITAKSKGMAYIEISSAVDNRISTYSVIEVEQRPYVVKFVDYNGNVLK